MATADLIGSVRKTEKMAGMMATRVSKLIWANAAEIGMALDSEYVKAIKQSETTGSLVVKVEFALIQDKTLAVKSRLSWETKEKIVKEGDLDVYDPNQPDLPFEGVEKHEPEGQGQPPVDPPPAEPAPPPAAAKAPKKKKR